MDFQNIRYEVEDGIAVLTFARGDKLNAMNGAMFRDIMAGLDLADADDDVRALIVTGEGRAFCAGADLSRGEGTFISPESETLEVPEGQSVYSQEGAREAGGILALRLYDMKKPIIAAINGPSAGMGTTIPLGMDVRLASETAKFGFVFARRGMVPETGASFFLPRIVGISRALEWCYSGRPVSAAEALAGGLVSKVLPPEDLLPEAKRLAREMTEHSAPVSIALTRQMLWRGLGMTHPMDAHRVESRGIYARGRARDVGEGISAFLEKRQPVFPDRVSRDMPDYYPWWEEPEYS